MTQIDRTLQPGALHRQTGALHPGTKQRQQLVPIHLDGFLLCVGPGRSLCRVRLHEGFEQVRDDGQDRPAVGDFRFGVVLPEQLGQDL